MRGSRGRFVSLAGWRIAGMLLLPPSYATCSSTGLEIALLGALGRAALIMLGSGVVSEAAGGLG